VKKIMNSTGVFTISIDTELAWGESHRPIRPGVLEALGREREVIRRLLGLFSKYDIRATWAVVGHLFLTTSCTWENGVAHSEISRPITRKSTRDWFFQHPRDEMDPLWYGEDIVKLIRGTQPAQEIGSHSFCHLPFDEVTTCTEAIRTDIQMAKRLHEGSGIQFQTFVFPWNVVGYRSLLAEAGIRVYRGRSARWYDGVPVARRALNFLHYLLALSPSTVRATVDDLGMINVPDSMLLLSRAGFRRLVPPQTLVDMASVGLHRAVARGEIFHLWFHPSDFVFETDRQFQVLETILQTANSLKDSGALKVLTMGDVQERVAEEDRDASFGQHSSQGYAHGIGSPPESLQIKQPPGTARGLLSSGSPIAAIRAKAIERHDVTADYFEEEYQGMARDYFSSSFAFGRRKMELVLEGVLQRLSLDSKILDVGCGTGEQVRKCRQRGFDVTGLEPAPKMRAIAKAHNPRAPILDGVITNLPFPDQTFDLILAIEVLRYLHRTDVEQAYREMVRVLKPGGCLFFTMVNRYAVNGFYIYNEFRKVLCRFRGAQEPLHCEFVTPRQIRLDLVKLGISRIDFFGKVYVPIRLAYKIHGTVGRGMARFLEPFDDWLSQRVWMTPIAGQLVVVAGRPNIPKPADPTCVLSIPTQVTHGDLGFKEVRR